MCVQDVPRRIGEIDVQDDRVTLMGGLLWLCGFVFGGDCGKGERQTSSREKKRESTLIMRKIISSTLRSPAQKPAIALR